MIRKAKAVWRGTGRTGNGALSTESGVLADTPIPSKPVSRMRRVPIPRADRGGPCRLLHHGARLRLQAAGFTATELSTEAAVTLEPEGQGFRISSSALTLRAQVPNLTKQH